MGYETELPPVPDRQGELALIASIKKSFQSQSWKRHYMAEGPRQVKMDNDDREMSHRKPFIINLLKGGLIASFISMPLHTFLKKSPAGIPFFSKPKMIVVHNKELNVNMRTLYRSAVLRIPFIIGFSLFYATYYTHTRSRQIDNPIRSKIVLPKL